MSDGFDFGTPPDRREARQFEPPPWEQEAFEKHRREQAELERAEREREQGAQAELAAKLEDLGASTAVPAETSQGEPVALRVAQVEPDAGLANAADRPRLDERQVEQMLFELQAEEPRAFEQVWMVIVGSGVIVGLIGIVMVVWGAVALTKVGGAAGFGGTVLVLFGIAFAGIGGWLIYTGLHRRGVL